MSRPYTFYINGQMYSIYKVMDGDRKLQVDGVEHLGVIDFTQNTIYLNWEISPDIRDRILLHELTHAVINSCGMQARDTFTQEDVCEIMAHHADNICEIKDSFWGWCRNEK